MTYDVTIGEDERFSDVTGGGADDKSLVTGTGYIKADWIDESTDYPEDSALAIANANPGASVPNGAAQVFTGMEFTGSESQTVKFTVSLDYDVELVCWGGGGKVKVKTFVYDAGQDKFLEKDLIDEASNSGNVIQLWQKKGTAKEDMFVEDVQPGDTLAVGTRVIVAASAAAVADAYADSWPKQEGTEHVQQNWVDVDWQ